AALRAGPAWYLVRRPWQCRSLWRRWRRRWRRRHSHEGRPMTGLRVSEDELRRFVVTRLDLMEASEFERARDGRAVADLARTRGSREGPNSARLPAAAASPELGGRPQAP